MSEELKVGDLVYYKDYFCEVVDICKDAYGNRWAHLKRKFRSDGSKMRSRWETKIYPEWIRRADLYFQRVINEKLKLIEVYKKLMNEQTVLQADNGNPGQ